MSIAKLTAVHEKFQISLEHKLEPVPAIKAVLTIPGENNTYSKRVSTLFESGATLAEAEEKAVNKAIGMLLGNDETKELVQSAEMLDISFTEIALKNGIAIRANIITFKDMKPYRQVQSIAGTETYALKSAVNKVLGV